MGNEVSNLVPNLKLDDNQKSGAEPSWLGAQSMNNISFAGNAVSSARQLSACLQCPAPCARAPEVRPSSRDMHVPCRLPPVCRLRCKASMSGAQAGA